MIVHAASCNGDPDSGGCDCDGVPEKVREAKARWPERALKESQAFQALMLADDGVPAPPVRCRCDAFGDGPCPVHTVCKVCETRGACYYAEDDTTPLCAECAA